MSVAEENIRKASDYMTAPGYLFHGKVEALASAMLRNGTGIGLCEAGQVVIGWFLADMIEGNELHEAISFLLSSAFAK